MNVLDQANGEGWTLYHGDCVDVMSGIPDNSIHYSIFSSPFASLYTYSASPRDMGNVTSHDEFFEQHRHMVDQLYRVLKPGRLASLHCMLLPTSKQRDGFIGLTDFRGQLIKQCQDAGFVFHSEVCIWKDPVTAMQRTKALGLLHKQIRKDSAMSRQGIPDHLVTVRKPGENLEPVTHGKTRCRACGHSAADHDREVVHDFEGQSDVYAACNRCECQGWTGTEDLPVQVWQRYASPVWASTHGVDTDGFHILGDDQLPNDPSSGINPSDTLQYRSAREHEDERHVCPLQLDVIRRAVHLWSNPGDVVLSPFTGIGSEGYVSLQMGRKFIGAELKTSYFKQAAANLRSAASPAQMEIKL